MAMLVTADGGRHRHGRNHRHGRQGRQNNEASEAVPGKPFSYQHFLGINDQKCSQMCNSSLSFSKKFQIFYSLIPCNILNDYTLDFRSLDILSNSKTQRIIKCKKF